ncbi:hypothetical protein O1L60_04310 [Streptomyces diastatochromogenes]|nr:hypothetical protein [Streptomyces diastatochromogenes]
MYREANVLPPATTKGEDGKSVKVGARDVAVWLTAVEYAREHPEETVYFVSENHRDFTKGTGGYRWPMDEDVVGLGDRFVHLTNVGELLETVAPPVAVAPDTAHDVLVKSSDFIIEAGLSSWASGETPFNVRLQDGSVAFGRYWAPYEDPAAHLLEVRDIQGFRLGDQEWCLAVTRWQFAGTAFVSMFTTQSGAFPTPVLQLAACEWEATVLVPLNAGDEHAPRVMKSGPVKLAGDPSEVDWPMPPTGLEYARYLAEQAEREGRKVSWPEVFLASMIAFPSVRERVDLTQYMPAQPRGAARSELEL